MWLWIFKYSQNTQSGFRKETGWPAPSRRRNCAQEVAQKCIGFEHLAATYSQTRLTAKRPESNQNFNCKICVADFGILKLLILNELFFAARAGNLLKPA
jgi:hypothetical protein